MPIVLISESLLRRSTATGGHLLRDRVLCGCYVRMNAGKRTFRIDKARTKALDVFTANGIPASACRRKPMQVKVLFCWSRVVLRCGVLVNLFFNHFLTFESRNGSQPLFEDASIRIKFVDGLNSHDRTNDFV